MLKLAYSQCGAKCATRKARRNTRKRMEKRKIDVDGRQDRNRKKKMSGGKMEKGKETRKV